MNENSSNNHSSANQLPSHSLYVADIDKQITEQNLYDRFQKFGNLVSLRIPRNMTTLESFGYAYVNYSDENSAENAISDCNLEKIGSSFMRVMKCVKDKTVWPSVSANILIDNLPECTNPKEIYEIFSQYGKIFSFKVNLDVIFIFFW